MSKNSNGCSGSVPIIVVEHAAETFPSADRAFAQTDLVSGFDDLPVAPLMVPFFVIVDEILVHDMPKVVLSKEHQPSFCAPRHCPISSRDRFSDGLFREEGIHGLIRIHIGLHPIAIAKN